MYRTKRTRNLLVIGALSVLSPTGAENLQITTYHGKELVEVGHLPHSLPTEMRSPELPAAATLAVVSLLILLPTQIRVRNVAILSTLIYAAIVGAACAVNTIVWAGSVLDVAPIWCDISTNIWFFTQYAVVGAVLCISMQLERITSCRTAAAPKWPNWRMYFEVVACFVYPILSIPIRYTLSTNRYVILEDVGCTAALHPSKFAVSFVFGPQLIVSTLITAFAWKAVFNLLRSRYCTDNQVVLPRSRFIRLLALCLLIGIWSPTIISLVFHFTLSLATLPWTGRSNLYKNFSYIPVLPFTPQSEPHKIQKAFYWLCVTNILLIAAILASGEDFRNDCKRAWAFLRCRKTSSSRRITVLVSHESHRSTETVMSEIPSTIVASKYDAESNRFSDTPSTALESRTSSQKGVDG